MSHSFSHIFYTKGRWLLLFAVLGAPIGYFVRILLSDVLSIDDIGILYGIISLITIVSSLNDFGMTESVNYFLPKAIRHNNANDARTLLRNVLVIQIITSTVLSIIAFVSAPWLARHYFGSVDAESAIRIFAIFFFGSNLFGWFNTIFRAMQDTFFQKGTDFLRNLSLLVSIAALVWLGSTSIAIYAWCWIVGLTVGIILSMIAYHVRYSHLLDRPPEDAPAPTTPFRKVLRYSIGTALAMNIGLFLSQMDMQIILVWLGTREAGYYANYLGLIGVPYLFLSPLFQFIFPLVSHMDPIADRDRIARLKSYAYMGLIILGAYMTMVFWIMGPSIAVFLFGEPFRYSGEILRWSAPFLVFNFLLQINFQILAGIGRATHRAKIYVWGVVINLLLSIIILAVTDLGARGIALAVGVAWVPIFLLSFHETKGYPVRLDGSIIVRNIVAILLIGYGIFLMQGYWVPLSRAENGAFVLTMGGLSILWLGILNLPLLRQLLYIAKQRG